MKKEMKKILTCVCAFVLLATSFCFAAEEQSADNMVEPRIDQATSKTVADKHGNKYKVAGLSSIVGKRADVHTEFTVTYYKGGEKAPVDKYTKNLTGVGRVWFSGAASDNQFTQSANRTGAKGTFVASKAYDFLIRTLHSTHKFSCQGGSTSFYTQM